MNKKHTGILIGTIIILIVFLFVTTGVVVAEGIHQAEVMQKQAIAAASREESRDDASIAKESAAESRSESREESKYDSELTADENDFDTSDDDYYSDSDTEDSVDNNYSDDSDADDDTYTVVVAQGQTLYSIANANGLTQSQLEALNPGVTADTLHAGQTLNIK